MIKFIVILCIVGLQFVSVSCEIYETKNGNIYYFETTQMFSWYEAISECARRNMSLIAIETEIKHLEILTNENTLFGTFWTSGQNIDREHFMWITTGENATASVNDFNTSPMCVCLSFHAFPFTSCDAKRGFICEENPFLKEKNLELNELKAELNKVKDNCTNDTSAKVQQDLHDLRKSHEREMERLEVKQNREISHLENENEKHLNQLILANAQLELKSKEIEMLTNLYKREIQLLKEKQNITENLLRASSADHTNNTSHYEMYKLIFNTQGCNN